MFNILKIKIINNREELIKILVENETENVAIEEIELSLKALENNDKYVTQNNLICSSYLPMNLPLYSLITYVVVPKVNTSKCFYRPSTKTLEQSKKIEGILKLKDFDIELVDSPRYQFFNDCVSKSNIVVFVGKPENANELVSKINKNTMFIYYGVGQNPVVVEKDGNTELASKKIVDAILFNYGQDCAKPNMILVNRVVAEQLKEKLIEEINKRIDDNKTTIKNINTLKEVANLLVDEHNNIIYGGKIDFYERTLEPVVICKDIKIDRDTYNEYYAPVFRLMVFDTVSDLKSYFSQTKYKEENMNISLFGTNKYIEKLPSSIILRDSIVSDIDNGYSEYGGYGKNVSFINYKGIKINKPLLINREIEDFYNNSIFDIEKFDNIPMLKRLKTLLYLEFKTNMTQIFSNDLLFSFIFGSYAKNRQKQTSDVDMFGCVDNINDNTLEKFKEWYFKFHYKYGLFPDFVYPGEIITREKLEDIINKNKDIEFNLANSSAVFDSIFYTQILTDKKTSFIGNERLLLQYEIQLKKYIPDWCNQIFDLLSRTNTIKSDREHMKCLMALANNDLLFFSKKLKYEEECSDKYAGIIKNLDDGFLIRKRGK